MYIPNEWEPAEWDESGIKESRRRICSHQKHRCFIAVGSDSGRGNKMPVPDMPGELDGDGNGTTTALREPAVPACVVVQAEAQAEAEGLAESRARSTQAGLSAPLPQVENADEKESGRVREAVGSYERDGEPDGIGNALAAEKQSAEVHGVAAGI